LGLVRELAAWIPPGVRSGPTYWWWRNFLARAQYWPTEKIEAWQLLRLRKIVQYAYQNTSGYRQLYDEAGIHPRDLVTLADLRHFPFVRKTLLQDNVRAFTVPHVKADFCATGGSSGIPFGFYQTKKLKQQVEQAFMHTGWTWLGWKLGMTSAALRGAFVGTPDNLFKYDSLHRELHLSSYHLNESTISQFLELIRRHDCRIIHAYPSHFYMLCDLAKSKNLADRTTARFAFLGSENIYEWQLESCQKVFPDMKIFSWYGHTEKAILAPWCEHSRKYHVWPFYGLCETLNPQDQKSSIGEEGELVGTSFHGLATPFIRYRTEDRAIRGGDHCPDCGRNFPLLEKILGRNHEVVVSKNGRYISMTAIAGSIHDDVFAGLVQFQFHQSEPGKIIFRYVTKSPAAVNKDVLLKALERTFGEDVSVELEAVAAIPHTRAGKFTYLDQRLKIQYGSDNAPA